MSNYLVGIGGTGAKCVESVVHLCASGMLPRSDLYVLFVDPDGANGNLDRTKVTLSSYLSSQSIETGSPTLFGTRIRSAEPSVWSPLLDNSNLNLEKSLEYQQLRGSDRGLHQLFDCLYSSKERTADLGVGFRGHPSIGAAILASTVGFQDVEPWNTFRALIQADKSKGEDANIFFCGSVFGGTGAAGLPTLATLIKDEVAAQDGASARLGCVLMLPYFSFDFGPDKLDELKADSGWFIPNTQSALHYYMQRDFLRVYDKMYVLGDASMPQTATASIGGNSQRNEPHFVELYAGLAALDFFHGGSRDGVALIARESASELGWPDLPPVGDTKVEDRLNDLTRFAFALLSVYSPAISEMKESDLFHLPWYVDLIKRREVKVDNDHLVAVRAYCKAYLTWIIGLHGSAKKDEVSLYDWRAFGTFEGGQGSLKSPFSLGGFDGIVGRGDKKSGLHLIWNYVSNRPRTEGAVGIGNLIRALYDASVELADRQ